MKKLSLAFLAWAAALAITPAAMADTYQYTIDGSNFSADLILTTTGSGTVQTITSVQGVFDIVGNASVWIPTTPTEDANGATADSLKLSSDGQFLFDNLLYPEESGNGILDWGGLLIDVNGYELNIFSGASGGGAPNDTYFYFADNGSYHFNDPIPDAKNPGVPATSDMGDRSESLTVVAPGTVVTPEPGSLFLLGTGLLGLALFVGRKAWRRSSDQMLNT